MRTQVGLFPRFHAGRCIELGGAEIAVVGGVATSASIGLRGIEVG